MLSVHLSRDYHVYFQIVGVFYGLNTLIIRRALMRLAGMSAGQSVIGRAFLQIIHHIYTWARGMTLTPCWMTFDPVVGFNIFLQVLHVLLALLHGYPLYNYAECYYNIAYQNQIFYETLLTQHQILVASCCSFLCAVSLFSGGWCEHNY